MQYRNGSLTKQKIYSCDGEFDDRTHWSNDKQYNQTTCAHTIPSFSVVHLSMPDHRYTCKQVEQMDAEDRQSHPITMSDGTIAYHFTLGGDSVQRKVLSAFSSLQNMERHQVPLCCPICKSGLGSYIYSKRGSQNLSSNQQRKNRNVMLFGKSHWKRSHPSVELQPVQISEACDHKRSDNNVTQVADVAAKRFRAGPPPSKTTDRKITCPITAVKRKQPDSETGASDRLQAAGKPITPLMRNTAYKDNGDSARHPSAQTKCVPKPTSTENIAKRRKSIIAKRDEKKSNHCPRRPNDYYMDAEGQIDYEHPRGWHPDDGESDMSDEDDENY